MNREAAERLLEDERLRAEEIRVRGSEILRMLDAGEGDAAALERELEDLMAEMRERTEVLNACARAAGRDWSA